MEVATVKGMCYQLTSNSKITDMGSYSDIISLELSKTWLSRSTRKGIQFLDIYLTSNQSWYGVVDDYWPLNDPSVFEVAKGKAALVYLAQSDNNYKNGYEELKMSIVA